MGTRVGVFGWGIVAPKSPNIEAFADNLQSSESWLAPFNGFGPDNFLVGMPEFRFADYRSWIDARFPPRRFMQLEEKMDLPSLYAIGAFIQSLDQNRGMEEVLQRLGSQAHIYIGMGLGNIGTIHNASIALDRAQRTWDRFWAEPSRNAELRRYLAGESQPDVNTPAHPALVAENAREAAEQEWLHYWAARSPELAIYLEELAEIENLSIDGEVESAKLSVIREKNRLRARLQKKWGAPDPPWLVTADVVWNIPNTPAAQVSMIGQITGLTFAPSAACSTFGVALRLALRAIECGDAKAVVVGATDPPPHPLVVGAFYTARVISAEGRVSVPLTRLQGTHVSGGSVIWIVADYDYMTALGFKPVGMQPLAVGVSSDAHHIITPTIEGPTAAIRQALTSANAQARDISTWDLHATATPGDHNEIKTMSALFPRTLLVTARKGTFGHGMSAGGGWELTAQYLGYERGRLFPTPIRRSEINPSIAELHDSFVLESDCEAPSGLAGKLSMLIGGVNACVISRPWDS
jgi:3-oxoacyl-[acyl-carrier-protein] synthase II